MDKWIPENVKSEKADLHLVVEKMETSMTQNYDYCKKINDTYPAHQEVWENRHLHLQQPKINTQKNNKERLIIFIQSQDIPSGVLHDNKIDLL